MTHGPCRCTEAQWLGEAQGAHAQAHIKSAWFPKLAATSETRAATSICARKRAGAPVTWVAQNAGSRACRSSSVLVHKQPALVMNHGCISGQLAAHSSPQAPPRMRTPTLCIHTSNPPRTPAPSTAPTARLTARPAHSCSQAAAWPLRAKPTRMSPPPPQLLWQQPKACGLALLHGPAFHRRCTTPWHHPPAPNPGSCTPTGRLAAAGC